MLFNPQIKFAWFLLFVLGEKACGVRQGLHALNHRIKEGNTAADEGPSQDWVFILNPLKVLNFFDKAVLCAADDGLTLGPTHHDALNKGLSADGCAEITRIAIIAF